VKDASRQLALYGCVAALTFIFASVLDRSDNLPTPAVDAWMAFAAPPIDLGRCVPARLVDRRPRKIVDVAPVYSSGVTMSGGLLLLSVTIDERGNVVDAHVLQPHPPFDAPAVKTVMKWKFEPALMRGLATCVVMNVSVTIDVR
jgi:TonB family protein